MLTRAAAPWFRLPPEMAGALIHRGAWSLCALEHSRIGPIGIEAAAAPFHHVALPLDRTPLRFSLDVDGRRRRGRSAPDTLTTIEAGAGGVTSWDDVFESACLYFTTEAMALALGQEVAEDRHDVRTNVALHSPALARLVRALQADAAAGQPHGKLIGDAIFVALAGELMPAGEHRRPPVYYDSADLRVQRALAFIHAHLTDALTILAIATAAATSPFHLNRIFHAALGCSIWQYVLRERARHAVALMHDPTLNLAGVAQLAGFESYAGFIGAVRNEYGRAPASVRRDIIA